MLSTRQTRSMTASSAPAVEPPAAFANFRVGDQDDGGSESDSNQSARSERSASPDKTPGQRTKSKKKRERKKVDALTNGLDVLLGSAFQEAGVGNRGVGGGGMGA